METRERPQRRSGLHLFPDQLPLVDGTAAVPVRRALGRRRDRRGQPRRPRAARQGRRRQRPGSTNGRAWATRSRRAAARRRAGPHAHRRRLPDARGALLPDRRALPAARTALARGVQEGGEIVRRRRGDAEAAAHRVGRGALWRQDRCRRCSCIPTARSAASPRRRMVFFDGFDITKEIQYFKGVPDLVARGIACLIVDGPGNGESVRFRDLPLIAETEKYATAAYDYLAGRKRGRSQAHRRDGDQPRRLLRAARGLARAALRLPASPGARNGIITTPGSGASSCWIPARCRRCRCRPSI